MLVATLQNIAGQGLPLVVGLVTIPLIKDGLGLESFGLLTLVWVALGYFTFFDLGLGRAVIKSIADFNARGDHKEVVPLTISNLVIILVLSVFGGSLIWLFADSLAIKVFHVSEELHAELITSLQLLALCLPVVNLTSGLRGVLEAHFRFFGINLLQVVTGSLTFLSPIFFLSGENKLVRIVFVLCLIRCMSFLAHAWLAYRILPGIFNLFRFRFSYFKRTIRFGSWVTISNLISPIIAYADRAVLGALVPATQVAFYTTPFEMVSKISIIPGALARYLFPDLASNQKDSVEEKLNSSLKYLAAGLFFISVIVILAARPAMRLWMGEDFGDSSFLLLQILMIGIFVNSIAYVPYTLLQAFDRPDLTAMIHVLELPFYLTFLYFMTAHFGLVGAAVSWAARAYLDMLLLFLVTSWKFKDRTASMLKHTGYVTGLAGVLVILTN